jgi:hypothetical protein
MMARRRTKVSPEIREFWRLLDDRVSLYQAWSEFDKRRSVGAAEFTVEALMFSLRKGVAALNDPNTLQRLSQLDERQLLEVMTRLQKFRPEIAPAWTPEQVEVLAAVRGKL